MHFVHILIMYVVSECVNFARITLFYARQFPAVCFYKGRLINKLHNSVILLIF